MASRTTLTWLALWYCTPFSQLTPVHKARPLALAAPSCQIQLFDHRKLREWPLVPLSLGSLFGTALRFHSLHLSIKPGLWRWRHQASQIQLFDHRKLREWPLVPLSLGSLFGTALRFPQLTPVQWRSKPIPGTRVPASECRPCRAGHAACGIGLLRSESFRRPAFTSDVQAGGRRRHKGDATSLCLGASVVQSAFCIHAHGST